MSVLRVLGKLAGEAKISTGSATVWRITASHIDLLTAAHVITGTTNVYVTAPEIRGTNLPVTVLGAAATSDVAVLRLDTGRLWQLGWPRADLREWARGYVGSLQALVPAASTVAGPVPDATGTAVGFPLNLPERMRSRGQVAMQIFNTRIMYHLSEDLNKGNSGGALFDEEGRWWGIPVAAPDGAKDISFCVTHMEALSVAESIVAYWEAQGAFANTEVDVTLSGSFTVGASIPFGSVLPGLEATVEIVPSAYDGVWARVGNGPIAKLWWWMRLAAPGTYEFPGSSLGLVQVVHHVNLPVRPLVRGQEMPSTVRLGDMIVAQLCSDHLEHFPHPPLSRFWPRLIVVDARPGTTAAAHIGSLVYDVDGEPVCTTDQLEAHPHPVMVTTARGPWIHNDADAAGPSSP